MRESKPRKPPKRIEITVIEDSSTTFWELPNVSILVRTTSPGVTSTMNSPTAKTKEVVLLVTEATSSPRANAKAALTIPDKAA